jgi:5'(3')-deoxyribonucleotidase
MCGHKFILRGDLLIDDRTYNLEKFVGDTLLFTTPHNAIENGYTRVNSWKEIAEQLL